MAWNFAAGPARLPDAVLAEAGALFQRVDDGACTIERPFSGPRFRAVLANARQRLAELLDLPSNYRILFMAGGAMQQFALLPMNLAKAGQPLAYADSGYWSQRARREGGWSGPLIEAARHPGVTALAAPAAGHWVLPADCAYCHITPNETADGIAYPALPDTGAVPLVADCTSALLLAPLAIEKFGLIYASAQKNIGPAGLCVVIVREDLLERSPAVLPAVFSYRRQAEAGSCVNTPPMLALEVAALVFEWIAGQGGLPAMAAANQAKAALLYGAIDGSRGFYRAPVEAAHRSPVNVRFHLVAEELTERFLAEAAVASLHHLRGHPQVGGVRASLYNAMPLAGVAALVDFMADFAGRHG